MKTPLRIVVVLMLAIFSCFAQPFGLSNRVANTTLQMPAALPIYGLAISNAFPGVTFSNPICIASPPGETNRLFVLERAGRVTVITNLAAPNRTLFMDISSRVITAGEQGLLGIAFHPNYAANGYFYLFYSLVTNSTGTTMTNERVSRFQTSPSNPNVGMVASELPLITQADDFSNHNGGDLHFGPDGYLYISLGDEGMQNDAGNNSQRIDKDFFSGILRIDVDKLAGNLPPNPHASLMNATNYFVPADNPFVGATQFNGITLTNPVRTEYWAVGLRNPWRFSFDPVTGTLYCGDVGGSLREEVDVIVKGGNYGWAYREGTIAGPKSAQAPPGFTSIPPITEYNHGSATNQGNSITGGVMYRGTRVPPLDGKYVFADDVSGNVWTLTPNGTNTVPFQAIFSGTTRDPDIVAFGIDPSNGDVLMADIVQNRISRIVYAPTNGAPPPPTLAQTGAFSDLVNLTPNPGIVEYDVNVPQWADNAITRHWFTITNVSSRMGFRATNSWQFVSSVAWIQHFELEMTNGVPESRRRIETRFLVRDAAGAGYGVTYRWNSPTNAVLVPVEGANENLAINDGGIMRDQLWHYPAQSECVTCHNAASGRALGFNTPQLNRNFLYPNGVTDNQIRALDNVNYFGPPRPTNFNLLITLARSDDESWSAEYRSRSYLMANCAQCHLAGTNGAWDGRIYNPISLVNLINGRLTNSAGDANNRVVVPGDTAHSMLLTRLASTGPDKMPPLGAFLVDTQAVSLLTSWIQNELPNYRTFAQWQVAYFGSSNAPQAAATADPDGDGARNMFEYLTGTNPTNSTPDGWGISAQRSGAGVDISFPRIANRFFEVQWSTNLTTNAASWRALDVFENRPFAAISNQTWRVPDTTTNDAARFYRARVSEP
jgi:glucose/arabinose dehydrogenase